MAIKVAQLRAGSADPRDDVRRLIHALNFSEDILAFPLPIAPETVIDTATCRVGGIAVDRSIFRRLLHDARWFVYGAGWVDPRDSAGVTVSLVYVKDDASTVTLGSQTWTGSGFVKRTLGPFDVFGTAGVPAGETIPIIELRAVKVTSAMAELRTWTLWLRLLASKQ